MKINHIITESLLFEQQLKEDPIYKDFYSAGKMLVEYKMSQEQIKQLFKAVADGAAAGGNVDKEGDAPASNRTLLGKGADVASTISKAFDSVKTKISQSGPVSGFDVAFDNMQSKLLNAAGGEKGAVGKALAKYREFAHKHPVMQGAIYSGLIALAGISGAGLGGAALLGGIKVFDKLLQGDKASSALWSGFKTGAMAYGASKLGDYIKGHNQQAPANPDDFGATTAGETTRIAGQPVIPGQPLSDTQMSVMQQSMAAGNSYPPEIMAQYNAQLSGGAGAVAQGAGNAVSGGGVPGQFDGGQYTVMKGDTLGHIAQANGVSVQDLKGLNPQIDFSKAIQPGMNIELPPAGDNAGSVWQGYTGGTYGDQAASAAKGAGDMAAQQSIPGANNLQPGTSPDDAALDIRSRLNTGPGPVPAEPDIGLDAKDTSSLTNTSADVTGGEESLKPPRGAKMSADYLKKVISGQHPRPLISPEDAQKALDWQAQNGGQLQQAAPDNALLGGNTPVPGGNGFSREYLERAADPNRTGRYMISVEKAKQLLNQSYVNPKPMLEYIDRDATVRSWVLRESVGKPRGGVALTEAGRQAVFRAVSEGPWDDIKAGAGKFVKGLGQGFTNPGVRNIKNLDTSQMAGAQVGAAGNKLAKGYGKLAGMVQRGADAVGGVVKKGWDSAANKITYDKLDLNWRKNYKEFDPTGGKGSVDSEVVADFLRKQGVKDGLISSVYKQLGIPFGGAQAQQSQPAQDQAQQGQQQAQPAPVQQKQQGQATTTTTGKNEPEQDNILTKSIKGANQAWKRGMSTPLGQSVVAPTPVPRSTAKTSQATTATATPGAQPAVPGAAVPAVTPAPATATAAPAVKKHTGGKVAGQLSQTPGAIKKRAARAAASSANKAGAGAFGQMASQLGQAGQAAPAAAPAAMPKFGPGVSPQMTVAPTKASYNINLPKAAPTAPAKKAVQTAGKIDRRPAVNEQIDIAEALWRKMKSK